MGANRDAIYNYMNQLTINGSDILTAIDSYGFKNKALLIQKEYTVKTSKTQITIGKMMDYFVNVPYKIEFNNAIAVKNILDYAMKIDNWYMGSSSQTYRKNLFISNTWCDMYQIHRNHNFPAIAGTDDDTAQFDGFPCYRCGIIFPKRNITIDHQKPQSGGEYLAVLKIFRALGLTASGPTGTKGKFFAGPVAPLPKVPVKIVKNKGMDFEEDKPDTKYTLSRDGVLLLSLAYAANAPIEQYCMHSLVNFKPLCGACNASKNNRTMNKTDYDDDDDN